VSNAPAAFTLPVVIILLFMAGLALVTAQRGWAGTLRRESKLGIHSQAASHSDNAFAVANKVAAPVVGGASVMAVVLAVLVVVLPLPTVASVVVGVISLIAVLVMLVAGGLLGEKAARVVPVPARRPNSGGSCGGCGCGSGGCAGLTRNN